ncbi:MAG: S-layer homology domain-containing protein [Epulopiscium sp.]|nr:S-layer homology domain-containing protein [Candidatus Epulonipiscium sp.]
MKKTKRLLLVSILFIGILSVPITAATPQQTYAGSQLATLQLLKGYEDGSLRLDQNINRAEMTVLLLRVLGHEESIVIGAEKQQFQDVSSSYWGKPWIQKAAQLQLIQGYPGRTFRPVQPISYAETIALMVRVLKREEQLEGEWPINYMNRGKELGIVSPTLKKGPNEVLTRGEVAEIVWKTLLVKTK